MRAISASYVPKSYADLLRGVQQTLFVGQREIDEAWVRTYHETGRLIDSHVLSANALTMSETIIFAPLVDMG
jgi:hypothetical protein